MKITAKRRITMTQKLRWLGLLLITAMLSLAVTVSAQGTLTPTPVPDPNAQITWPPPVYVVRGPFTVYGSANLPNMTGWFLEQKEVDLTVSDDQGWIPVTLPTRTATTNSVLGVWDTTEVEDGIYSLRLNVSLSNGTRTFAVISPLRVENEPPPFGGVEQPNGVPTQGALPTLLPTPTAFSSVPQATARINGNVRRGDGTQYEVIGSITAGTTVTIVGTSALGTNWYLVVLPNGTQGWVAPSIVEVTGNLATVPRVNPPPPPTATPVTSALTPVHRTAARPSTSTWMWRTSGRALAQVARLRLTITAKQTVRSRPVRLARSRPSLPARP